MTLREWLESLTERVEQSHEYNAIRGRCSCGLKTRDINTIKSHYLDAVEEIIEGEGWTFP